MNRQTVKQIEPAIIQTFDQQFWPLVIATTVCCGMGVGAAIVLLDGLLLWLTLLLLPSLAVLATWVLYMIGDKRLNRSIQLAIVCSLAGHLLFIMLAGAFSIFQTTPFKANPQAEKPLPRVIEISDSRAKFVWEQPNQVPTPEPVVDLVKQAVESTTDMTPQPIPIENTRPTTDPSLVRQENKSQSLPRYDQSLSQLRRQTNSQELKTSVATLSKPKSLPLQTPPANDLENPTSQNEVAKKSETATEANDSQSLAKMIQQTEKSEVTPRFSESVSISERTSRIAETAEAKVKLADSAPQRATQAAIDQLSVAASAPSPTRRTSTDSQSKPLNPTVDLIAEMPRENEAAAPQGDLAVQPRQVFADLPRQDAATPNLSRSSSSIQPDQQSNALARFQSSTDAQRRETNEQPIEFPNPLDSLAQATTPRRSRLDNEIPTSPLELERPTESIQTESSAMATELTPVDQSVTRSERGIVGLGKANNVQQGAAGMTSPAMQPSDASLQRSSQSRPTETRQLIASEKSLQRRASGLAPQPTSTIKANTELPSQLVGAQVTSPKSLDSTATQIESSTNTNRSETSLEKGAAMVDLGPTKRLPEPLENQRVSGGGKPKTQIVQTQPSRRSAGSSDQIPSLVDAAANPIAAAPVTLAAPVSGSGNVGEMLAAEVGPRERSDPTMLQRVTASDNQTTNGPNRESALTESAPRRANYQSGSEQESLAASQDGSINRFRGLQSSEVSAAPVLKGETGIGLIADSTGSGAASAAAAESYSQADRGQLTQRTALSSSSISGIGRTATSPFRQTALESKADQSSAPRRATRSGITDIANQDQPVPSQTPSRQRNPTAAASERLMPRPLQVAFGSTVGQTQAASDTRLTGDDPGQSATATITNQAELVRGEIQYQPPGIALELAALEGAAGLSNRPSQELGILDRMSDPESQLIEPFPITRFRQPTSGGVPAINPDAVVAKEAFRKRLPAELANSAAPMTEESIQLGLEFLVRHQQANGSWSLGQFDRDHPQSASQLHSDSAATGLAVLAFQGAGYNHREFKYASVVNRGIQWLLENQQDNGNLYLSSDQRSDKACHFYSHGIATLALTEAYGMTNDPQIKQAAQRAIDYILATQSPVKGGWRYFDHPDLRSTDTSVTGWMMMALHSGVLVGLDVDQDVFDGVDRWLGDAADGDHSLRYRYNPYAIDVEGFSRVHGRQPTPSMTSVGLLMRIYRGLDRDSAELERTLQWMINQQAPADRSTETRDTYYWYYATQVLKYVDGPSWEQWEQQLRPMLIRTQQKNGPLAGSWHPYEPVPDRWGAFGGRLYVTTMNLLSLEVKYRLLPLYQEIKPPYESIQESQPLRSK